MTISYPILPNQLNSSEDFAGDMIVNQGIGFRDIYFPVVNLSLLRHELNPEFINKFIDYAYIVFQQVQDIIVLPNMLIGLEFRALLDTDIQCFYFQGKDAEYKIYCKEAFVILKEGYKVNKRVWVPFLATAGCLEVNMDSEYARKFLENELIKDWVPEL